MPRLPVLWLLSRSPRLFSVSPTPLGVKLKPMSHGEFGKQGAAGALVLDLQLNSDCKGIPAETTESFGSLQPRLVSLLQMHENVFTHIRPPLGRSCVRGTTARRQGHPRGPLTRRARSIVHCFCALSFFDKSNVSNESDPVLKVKPTIWMAPAVRATGFDTS